MFSDDQLKRKDIDTLKRWARHKLGDYRVAIKDITANNVYWRGVRWENRPNTIDNLSYPPAGVTNLGRANRPGQSMFYCSLGPPAVFPELRVRQGDKVALSEWVNTERLWMHSLGYHHASLRRLGTRNLSARQQLSQPFIGEPKANARLRGDLSLAFTRDISDEQDSHYKLSVAINELLFDSAEPIRPVEGGPATDRAAGTVYPAMRLRGDADNAVFWPQFVDSSLRIKSVRYVLIEAADEARSAYTFLTLAFANAFSGRKIIWQDQLRPERERRSHFALEGNAWVLRNDFGHIIDIH